MAGKWIQKAIKEKGSLRAIAAKEGALKDNIEVGWLEDATKRPGKVGKKARMARTLKSLSKRGGRK